MASRTPKPARPPLRKKRVAVSVAPSRERSVRKRPPRQGEPSAPAAESETEPAAAGPEPMTPRSSDEEADRPRFVSPSEARKAGRRPPR